MGAFLIKGSCYEKDFATDVLLHLMVIYYQGPVNEFGHFLDLLLKNSCRNCELVSVSVCGSVFR